jgi:hypothetical protein
MAVLRQPPARNWPRKVEVGPACRAGPHMLLGLVFATGSRPAGGTCFPGGNCPKASLTICVRMCYTNQRRNQCARRSLRAMFRAEGRPGSLTKHTGTRSPPHMAGIAWKKRDLLTKTQRRHWLHRLSTPERFSRFTLADNRDGPFPGAAGSGNGSTLRLPSLPMQHVPQKYKSTYDSQRRRKN